MGPGPEGPEALQSGSSESYAALKVHSFSRFRAVQSAQFVPELGTTPGSFPDISHGLE